MSTKAAKIKKIVTGVVIALVLCALIVFGFHFSCRLKAKGQDNYHYSRNVVVVNNDIQA